MKHQTIIKVQNLTTSTQLAVVIMDLREHYKEYRLPQPPLPDDVLSLVPCSLDVSESRGANGLVTGKVLITDPKGEVLFEREWVVNPGTS
jgi:hypothetical protein